MSGSGELHARSAAVNSGRRQREEESRHANILNHKRVQLTEHVRERRTISQQRKRLRVYSVGDERGADAVAGGIAEQYNQVFFVDWRDQAEVAADSVRWMIESVVTQASPENGYWSRALLR